MKISAETVDKLFRGMKARIDRMSISEQVKELKKCAKLQHDIGFRHIESLILQAADTIEDLSSKLQSANDDTWIPCAEKKPKENEEVMLTFKNSAGLHVGEATYKQDMFFYITDTVFGYYEEVYKNPIAWIPKLKPYNPQ